jgi:hypothetical protein
VSTALDTPEKTARTDRPAGGPPHAAITSDSGVPMSTSTTAGRTTSPETVQHTVPGDPAVPMVRNQSGPRARMWVTLASVSTLFTSVGLAVSPKASRAPGSGSRAVHPSCGPVTNRPCR